EPKRRYPVLVDLVGYTGSGQSHLGWRNFTENVPERLDRLIAEGRMGSVVVVFPDCFTALGGNQYINSSAIGNYADYLLEEILPLVDERYRTIADREHRGVFGKSSGGYGAMIHAMRYADHWSAAACHSGDMYFEFAYLTEFPRALNVLARHECSPQKFLEAFHSSEKPSDEEVHTLMMLAMAASYDPDSDTPLGYHLPLDLYTGEIHEERWQRWLRHDPIHLVKECGDSLRRMKLLYIDCGFRDQYHLHYGARILHRELEAAEIAHHYEEFDDNHSRIDYRMDISLPMLAKAVGA
ncbi:MAG: alpha/beta hydrolase-fold protein, partial [Planctomycetota bacterium]